MSLAVTIAPAWLGPPAPASAATCADFPDQAAAQRAADTRDADADGVYCEALPCPCLRPGHGGAAPAEPSQPGPGPARRRRAAGAQSDVLTRGDCRRGPRADPRCTPGARFARVTREQVCTAGYAGRVRDVSQPDKARVYAAYGILSHRPGEYEVDHLIALELGGSNSPRNLWPQPYGGPIGANDKDRLEDHLHAEVCAGQITLAQAQRLSVARWTTGSLTRARPARADRPRSPAGPAPDSSPATGDHPGGTKRSDSTPGGLGYAVVLGAVVALVWWRRRRLRR